MKVLVVGSGGREHVLVWKIRQSPLVDKIYAAPGNPGMAEEGAECIPIPAGNIIGLRDFALEKAISLTIVGPEGPLAAGIVDRFQERGLKIFGPTQAAARLEWDKIWAMDFMNRHAIPTGWHYAFTRAEYCLNFVKFVSWPPVVIKNPDPVAGKGSFVCHNYDEVEQAVAAIQRQQEKAAREYGGRSEPCFLVMEHLKGQEVSIIAITNGERLVYFPPSQDHKRLLDDDQGPMTGGMGAIAPAPFVTPELQTVVHEQIMLPTIRAMAKEGRPFKGVLYAGLILTTDGPKVLEFNARFGDPEAQVILPLLKSDLVELMLAAIDGSLGKANIELEDKAGVCVVFAGDKYPEGKSQGHQISGIDDAELFGQVKIFQASTARTSTGALITNGGRVLGVTTWDITLSLAHRRAYIAAGHIKFKDVYYRRDIGQRALAYLKDR